MALVLWIISVIAIGKGICLIGGIFYWAIFHLLSCFWICRHFAESAKALLGALWSLFCWLPRWLRWLAASLAFVLAVALFTTEASVPAQVGQGCETAKAWTYDLDKRLVRLLDDDLSPLCVHHWPLSTEKDNFCQHADIFIDSRSEMVQPWIALRDTMVRAWIVAKSASETPTENDIATESEAAAIEVAFQEIRGLSQDCLANCDAFQHSFNSTVGVIDEVMATVYVEITQQKDTAWVLRKGASYQRGLMNIMERLARAKTAATRLDRYTRSDPCMVDAIEKMDRDWRSVTEASALEPLRRLWRYTTYEEGEGGESGGVGEDSGSGSGEDGSRDGSGEGSGGGGE